MCNLHLLQCASKHVIFYYLYLTPPLTHCLDRFLNYYRLSNERSIVIAGIVLIF